MTISPRESVISHTLSETAVSNSRLVSPRNFPWYLHDRILLESVSLWMALFWLACEPCRLLLLLLLCEILRNARPYIKTKAILKHKTYMLTFIAKSHTFTHACVYQLSLRWIYKQTTPTRVVDAGSKTTWRYVYCSAARPSCYDHCPCRLQQITLGTKIKHGTSTTYA